MDDSVPHGWCYYWKATDLTGMSDAVIDIVAEHAYRAASPRSYALMFHLGGAVARAPRDATAYPGRDVGNNIIIDAAWLPEQDDSVAAAETAWAREFLDALHSHSDGVYVNFLDSDDDSSRVREAYGDKTYGGSPRRRRSTTPRTCSTTTRTFHPAVLDHLIRQGGNIGYIAVIENRRIEMTARAHPPFDVELESALGAVPGFFTTLEPDSIAEFRAATTRPSSLDEVIRGWRVEVTDHAVTGHGGGEIIVTVLRRSGHKGGEGRGVFLIHGGGMVGGSRWAVAPMLVEWVLEYGAVAAAVEYRLAPEFPDPVPVEDCYAGLEWFAGRAEGSASTRDGCWSAARAPVGA